MSEKRVNKRIRKILERDLAEAVAHLLHAEALGEADYNGKNEALQKEAELKAKVLGRFEASVRRGPPPPTPAPGPAKWGNG